MVGGQTSSSVLGSMKLRKYIGLPSERKKKLGSPRKTWNAVTGNLRLIVEVQKKKLLDLFSNLTPMCLPPCLP